MAAPETDGRMLAHETAIPHGCGELVLVVDDEDAIRSIMQRTLSSFGYRTMLAANGAEAVAMYAVYRYEIAVVIVIVDMTMPIMDGPATIIALTSIDPAVKIIGSSGLATDQSAWAQRARASCTSSRTRIARTPCSGCYTGSGDVVGR